MLCISISTILVLSVQLALIALFKFYGAGLSTLTPIDKAFEPISWVNIIKALNGQLTVDWQPPYNRPSAYGQINESIYPQTGWVNFPDHRKFNMWYYPEEGAIYWDAPKGGTANIWWGVVGTGLECQSEETGHTFGAVNSDVTVEIGQTITLVCKIDVSGVLKKDITWSKDGVPITPEGFMRTKLSEDRLVLKLPDVDASDAGTYSCQAGKNGKTDSAEFKVEVEIPAISRVSISDTKGEAETPMIPRVEVSPTRSTLNCKKGQKGCTIYFQIKTTDESKVTKKNVQICKIGNGIRGKCKKGKGKGSLFELGLSKEVIDGSYICVVTLKGQEYVSDAVTVSFPRYR